MSDNHSESTQPANDQSAPTEVAKEEASAPVDPIVAITAERDKYRDQLLRTAADFDNYRKRSRKEIDDAGKRGKEESIREILPIADNLERAVAAAASAVDIAAVVEGVKMVLTLFHHSIDRLGVERIRAVGQKFDPNIHEAIQQIETNDQPVGHVVVELVSGYRLGERLIRPALVGVAKAPPEAAAEKPASVAPAAVETTAEPVETVAEAATPTE